MNRHLPYYSLINCRFWNHNKAPFFKCKHLKRSEGLYQNRTSYVHWLEYRLIQVFVYLFCRATLSVAGRISLFLFGFMRWGLVISTSWAETLDSPSSASWVLTSQACDAGYLKHENLECVHSSKLRTTPQRKIFLGIYWEKAQLSQAETFSKISNPNCKHKVCCATPY